MYLTAVWLYSKSCYLSSYHRREGGQILHAFFITNCGMGSAASKSEQ
ncbi:hypothetical protein [Dickeya dadantii]